MAWTDFFRSRYVRFLESELAALRKRHAEELETQKNLYLKQVDSAIQEANRGWAEADRLRQYLIPGLAASTRVTESSDKEPPAKLDDAETGTPFQRILKRAMKQQNEEAHLEEEARRANKFPTPKETPVVVPAQGE